LKSLTTSARAAHQRPFVGLAPHDHKAILLQVIGGGTAEPHRRRNFGWGNEAKKLQTSPDEVAYANGRLPTLNSQF